MEENLHNDAEGPVGRINSSKLGSQPQQQQNEPSLWLKTRAKIAGFTRLLGLTNK
jgi:hypothetical protein